MSNRLAAIPLALAVFACCGAVAAQEVASFTELTACRIDGQRVLLRGTFDGSACQKVQPIGHSEPRGTIIAVVIDTDRTADICTMQIVPVSFEQALKAPEPVFDLDVTVVDPDNRPQAHGVISLDEMATDCPAPAD